MLSICIHEKKIQCYTTSFSGEGQWNGRYRFTRFQRRKIYFSLLTISLHILINTYLFHRTSIGLSATFPPNGYCEWLNVYMESNWKCRGCKDYQVSPRTLVLLMWLRQYLKNWSFSLQHLLPHWTWFHCYRICCSSQVMRVQQKQYNKSSRSHRRYCFHFQDHPVCWKIIPLYREEGKHQLIIQSMVEGYWWDDPPSVPQLAVPIIVSHHCFRASLLSTDDLVHTVGCC